MIKNEVLTKKPFTRVTPTGYLNGKTTSDLSIASYYNNKIEYQILSQADFIREFYPSGQQDKFSRPFILIASNSRKTKWE